MPWDFAPWGCGRGKNGSCNNSHVQFEICEEFLINNRSHNKNTPGDKEYAQQVWDEAVRFTAYICEMYDIDPLGYVMINGVKVPTILDHKTSWELGLGSGHGDIRHWFPVVLGKDMADARQEVYNLMHSKQGKGWVKEGNNWYYYDASGKKVVGWQTIDGDTYYFDKNGVMQTGWLDYDGAKYYFGTNGKRVVDWKKIDGVWYFFDTNGKMVAAKWVRYNGAWYYLTDDGKMAVGWLNLDDGTYYCNASGAAVTGWKRVDRLWYYFDSNCRMVKSGWITIDDTKYYLYPSDGHMASAEWIDGLWCDYNGAQGYEYKGEWKSNAKGKWWEDESGWYPKNTTQKIDGVEYQFDEKGYLIQ